MNRQPRATQRLRSAWAAMPMAVLILLMPVLPRVASDAESAVRPSAALSLRGAVPIAPPSRDAIMAAETATEAGTRTDAETGIELVVSSQARQLADWVALTGDHAGAPFIIVDKQRANVFVFETDARLRAHSAVLLGSALGDDSVPGIGTRPMAQILPAERTTPAGRFVAERGRNTQGEDVVWVDYDAAISMHRVRTGNASERRAERLATLTIDDNRISYGCINVPVAFYENYIQPVFAVRKAMVYVLPDTKPMQEAFGMLQGAPTDFDVSRFEPFPATNGKGVFGDSRASR